MAQCCGGLYGAARAPQIRYKKLLTAVFESDEINNRKISKLCDYAAKNPHTIPKISSALEQRAFRELRGNREAYVAIAMKSFSKLLATCKSDIPSFAQTVLSLIRELLDNPDEEMRILGANTLYDFLASQSDAAYLLQLDSLVPKVCDLTRDTGEKRRKLKMAALRCILENFRMMERSGQLSACIDDLEATVLANLEVSGLAEGDPHAHRSNKFKREGLVAVAAVAQKVGMKGAAEAAMKEADTPSYLARESMLMLGKMSRDISTARRVLEPMLRYFDKFGKWTDGSGLPDAAIRLVQDAHEDAAGIVIQVLCLHTHSKDVEMQLPTRAAIIRMEAKVAEREGPPITGASIAALRDIMRHYRTGVLDAPEDADPEAVSQLNEACTDAANVFARKVGAPEPLLDMVAAVLERVPGHPDAARSTLKSVQMMVQAIVALPAATRDLEDRERDKDKEGGREERKEKHKNAPLTFSLPQALVMQLVQAMQAHEPSTRELAHDVLHILLDTPTLERSNTPRKDTTIAHAAAKFAQTWKERLQKDRADDELIPATASTAILASSTATAGTSTPLAHLAAPSAAAIRAAVANSDVAKESLRESHTLTEMAGGRGASRAAVAKDSRAVMASSRAVLGDKDDAEEKRSNKRKLAQKWRELAGGVRELADNVRDFVDDVRGKGERGAGSFGNEDELGDLSELHEASTVAVPVSGVEGPADDKLRQRRSSLDLDRDKDLKDALRADLPPGSKESKGATARIMKAASAAAAVSTSTIRSMASQAEKAMNLGKESSSGVSIGNPSASANFSGTLQHMPSHAAHAPKTRLQASQAELLLASFWAESRFSDNTPANYSCISRSAAMVVDHSPNRSAVRAASMALSWRDLALHPEEFGGNGSYNALPESQRLALFVMSHSLLSYVMRRVVPGSSLSPSKQELEVTSASPWLLPIDKGLVAVPASGSADIIPEGKNEGDASKNGTADVSVRGANQGLTEGPFAGFGSAGDNALAAKALHLIAPPSKSIPGTVPATPDCSLVATAIGTEGEKQVEFPEKDGPLVKLEVEAICASLAISPSSKSGLIDVTETMVRDSLLKPFEPEARLPAKPRRQSQLSPKVGVARVNSQPFIESVDGMTDYPAAPQVVVLPSARDLYYESKHMQGKPRPPDATADPTPPQATKVEHQAFRQLVPANDSANASPVRDAAAATTGKTKGADPYSELLSRVATAQQAYHAALSTALGGYSPHTIEADSLPPAPTKAPQAYNTQFLLPVNSRSSLAEAGSNASTDDDRGLDDMRFDAKLGGDDSIAAIRNVALASSRTKRQTFEAHSFSLPPTTPFDSFRRAAGC